MPFGARDVPAFLAELDVFLHFPHADYIEEFGRAPMEAMAAGVPVILPPEFEPTFGAAALYAAPDGGLAAGRAALARPRTSGRRAPRRAAPSSRHLRLRRLPRPPRPARGRREPAPPGAPPLGHRAGATRQWELVPGLLAALAAQTLGADDFEVLVVNNDAPAARARPARACRATPGCVDLRRPRLLRRAQRRRAPRRGGRWLVFTDADCRPDPGWLAAFAAAAAASPGRAARRAGAR